MARYFYPAQTRGKALAKLMQLAKENQNESMTAYVAKGTSPPWWLVGPTTDDAVVAGMLPVFTFISHAPPCFEPRQERMRSDLYGESMVCWADREEEAS